MTIAHDNFSLALGDVTNLMGFHAEHGGDGPGRRPVRLQSLNKSAVVLLCAAWESYVESVILEVAYASIHQAAGPDEMLQSIQTLTARHIKDAKDERVWRSAAGDGWRDLSRSVVRNKLWGFNTPKRHQVELLFRQILGVKDVDRNWEWHRSPAPQPSQRLDAFVALRGSIAHGERRAEAVRKRDVDEGVNLTTRLVAKIEERLAGEGLAAGDVNPQMALI